MSRPRILATLAVLIVFVETAWIFWPRGEKLAAPTVGDSIRRMRTPPVQPPVQENSGRESFSFEHEGKTVTVDLTNVRRCLQSMVRRDVGNVSVNNDAGLLEPGVGFLSWPLRKSLGMETIKTRKCRVIDFMNPSRSGGESYYLIRTFIDTETGILMRLQSYNRDGRREMAFTMERLKRGSDGTIKEQEGTVHLYDPGTKKVIGKQAYVALP